MPKQASQIDWTPGGGAREVRIGQTTICYGVGANQYYPRDRFAEIISLRTQVKALGMGSARRAMTAFLAEADARGVTVRLAASPLTKRTSLARLIGFYRSLGFELTGQAVNPAGHPYMLRPPIKPVAAPARPDAPEPEVAIDLSCAQ